MKTWEIHLPDYEFYLWNETNSPMQHSYVKEAYTAKKYAFVSDYVRFWALYNNGGIYLDTDMFVIKSLNALLQNDCFFGFETPAMNVVSCGIIGSKQNNEFIKQILLYYDKLKFNLDSINNLKVPLILTKNYDQYSRKNEIKVLPFDYFYPFPYTNRDDNLNFMDFKTANTYAIHLWDLSWVSTYDKLLSRSIKNIKKILNGS